MDSQQTLEAVITRARETALLETTVATLEWDERTGLPARAGSYRAEQITLLSGMIHRQRTDPKYGEQLSELATSSLAEGNTPEAATIRRLHKSFQRHARLPVDLVQATSKATVLGQQAWEKARHEDDFSLFEKHLAEIYGLRRQEAELLREDGTLYDALLDQYEEGGSSEQLTETFGQLREDLVRLVQQLSSAPNAPDGSCWQTPIPVKQQKKISHWVAEQIGYSFERGRLDETTHPFCTTLGPDDCRILTRYQESHFPSAFYGTLHEAGHGLYEQGLPTEWFGLPPGTFASLGIHESQSRMWENFVGRSAPFWSWAFPHLSNMVGGAWANFTEQQLYRDANHVAPSLIRVEADEVTYNLHILIRFELEQALLHEELAISDAPAAWNEKYEHYLGIRPPSNQDGILQDVHWSAGLIGYFPTYTLGNLYAAQLMEVAQKDVGPLDEQLAKGDFVPLLEWLRTKVHARGFCEHPGQLIEGICGAPLSHEPLIHYLRDKLEPIYGV